MRPPGVDRSGGGGSSRLGHRLALLTGVLLPLLLWHLAALRFDSPLILPPPATVLVATLAEIGSPAFLAAVAATVARALAALAIATMLALPLAGGAIRVALIGTLVRPTVLTVRAVPFISVTLLAVIWFESSLVPAFVALLMAFPLLYEAIWAAFSGLDDRLVEMARIFRMPWVRRVRHLWLPGAAGGIWAGVRAASGIVWKVTVAAEVIGRPVRGIGANMADARLYLEIERVLAWTVVLVAIAWAFDALLRVVESAPALPVRLARRGGVQHGNVRQPAGARPVAARAPEPRAVAISGATVAWPGRTIFEDLDLQLEAASVTAVMGPSGSGKTTLLRLVAGLSGAEAHVGSRRPIPPPRTAFVFQEPRLLPWRTALRNITCVTGVPRERAEDALRLVHLGPAADQRPGQLSGGMRQRLALARALALRPALLLIDEPLTGVDPDHREEIVASVEELLGELATTTLIATHDVAMATRVAGRVLVLDAPPAGIALDLRRPPDGWDEASRRHIADAVRRSRLPLR